MIGGSGDLSRPMRSYIGGTILEARVILRQFLRTDPVAISYLFGCGGKACGAVVDPVGDVLHYLDAARATGMKHSVRYRHPHSRRSSLCRTVFGRGRRCGICAVLRGRGAVPVPGRPRWRCPAAWEPWLVLTDHTLMVGDVGRTELATNAEEGARILFCSLKRLKTLPDYVEVLPGAYSGSVCGRGLSGKPASTIGFEKRHNLALRIADEQAFINSMLADFPPPLQRARELRAGNAGWSIS
jgi:hydroxyacylglutathione hydrolase